MMMMMMMMMVMNACCRVSHEATQRVDGGSDVESDDDNEDGDYTVFECRGLATVSLFYFIYLFYLTTLEHIQDTR